MPVPGKVALSAALGCVCVLWIGSTASPAQDLPPATKAAAFSSAPIELMYDKPYVAVMVNGRGPFRFLIDTGTGAQAMVSPELADELTMPVVGHARLTDPSGLGEQRSDIVLIHSLNIAGAKFAEVKAIRHKLYSEGENCRGVLGFTLFKDYLLTLNFPERRLVLARGEIAQDGSGSVLPFRMPDGVPIVALRIDGKHVEAQIDSGGTGLSLPEVVAARSEVSVDSDCIRKWRIAGDTIPDQGCAAAAGSTAGALHVQAGVRRNQSSISAGECGVDAPGKICCDIRPGEDAAAAFLEREDAAPQCIAYTAGADQRTEAPGIGPQAGAGGVKGQFLALSSEFRIFSCQG